MLFFSNRPACILFHKVNYQTIIVPYKILPERRFFSCLCCNFRWVSTNKHPLLFEMILSLHASKNFLIPVRPYFWKYLGLGEVRTDVCNHRPSINNPLCSYKKRSIDRHLKNDNTNSSNVFITITEPCCRCSDECRRLLIFFWDANEESGDDTGDNDQHKEVFTSRTLAPHLLD